MYLFKTNSHRERIMSCELKIEKLNMSKAKTQIKRNILPWERVRYDFLWRKNDVKLIVKTESQKENVQINGKKWLPMKKIWENLEICIKTKTRIQSKGMQ